MSYSLTDNDIKIIRSFAEMLHADSELKELVKRIDEVNQPIPDDGKRKDIGFTVRLVGKGKTLQEAWDDASENYDPQAEDPEDLEPEFIGYDQVFQDDDEEDENE